jgi:hypothetical protein
MSNPYQHRPPAGANPVRPGVPGRPGTRQGKSKRNTRIVIGVAAAALLCCCGFGALLNAAETPNASTGPTSSEAPRVTDPYTDDIFIAKVEKVTQGNVWVSVDGKRLMLILAHVGAGSTCFSELSPALQVRASAMLPVNSAVTVVRTDQVGGGNKVYLHPAASYDISKPPTGPSINERLIAEGSAILDPYLKREETAAPVTDQVTTIKAALPAVSIPYVDAMAKADIAAWDGRLGAVGQCRIRLDQDAARDRELWGPDGRPGTDDDPKRDYPSSPSIGNGGDDSDGDGWFCRRRWWC